MISKKLNKTNIKSKMHNPEVEVKAEVDKK